MTVLLSRLVFKTRLGAAALWSMGVLVLGLVVIALSTGEQPAGSAPGFLAGWLGVLLVLLVAALAGGYRRHAPVLFALIAGLSASIAALAARGLELSEFSLRLLTQPLPWIILGSGVVAMVSYTRALEQGAVGSMTGLYSVVEVLVPGIAGMILFSDAARPGWEVYKFAAIVCALGAGVFLALRSGSEALAAVAGGAPTDTLSPGGGA
ncbi:hypothetical protein [Glutamicibacter sp.]|uniref:hypothetical protein n=1 Tax=Glutamicibacter sp. TaxID=1931995 RepID=UPI0028BDC77B|nr:hypothetical protein [Glutamicibacter sp.]